MFLRNSTRTMHYLNTFMQRYDQLKHTINTSNIRLAVVCVCNVRHRLRNGLAQHTVVCCLSPFSRFSLFAFVFTRTESAQQKPSFDAMKLTPHSAAFSRDKLNYIIKQTRNLVSFNYCEYISYELLCKIVHVFGSSLCSDFQGEVFAKVLTHFVLEIIGSRAELAKLSN